VLINLQYIQYSITYRSYTGTICFLAGNWRHYYSSATTITCNGLSSLTNYNNWSASSSNISHTYFSVLLKSLNPTTAVRSWKVTSLFMFITLFLLDFYVLMHTCFHIEHHSRSSWSYVTAPLLWYGLRSFEVTGSDTIQSILSDCLLMVYSNDSSLLQRFWDMISRNTVTLTSESGVIQGHWKQHHLIDRIWLRIHVLA